MTSLHRLLATTIGAALLLAPAAVAAPAPTKHKAHHPKKSKSVVVGRVVYSARNC